MKNMETYKQGKRKPFRLSVPKWESGAYEN